MGLVMDWKGSWQSGGAVGSAGDEREDGEALQYGQECSCNGGYLVAGTGAWRAKNGRTK
jgi:hypothetical protein